MGEGGEGGKHSTRITTLERRPDEFVYRSLGSAHAMTIEP